MDIEPTNLKLRELCARNTLKNSQAVRDNCELTEAQRAHELGEIGKAAASASDNATANEKATDRVELSEQARNQSNLKLTTNIETTDQPAVGLAAGSNPVAETPPAQTPPQVDLTPDRAVEIPAAAGYVAGQVSASNNVSRKGNLIHTIFGEKPSRTFIVLVLLLILELWVLWVLFM